MPPRLAAAARQQYSIAATLLRTLRAAALEDRAAADVDEAAPHALVNRLVPAPVLRHAVAPWLPRRRAYRPEGAPEGGPVALPKERNTAGVVVGTTEAVLDTERLVLDGPHTAEELAAVAVHFLGIEAVALRRCTTAMEASFAELRDVADIEVSLCCDLVGAGGLPPLVRRCPDLRRLAVSGCKALGTEAVALSLAHCRSTLEALEVTNCRHVSCSDLAAHCTELPRLTTLRVQDSPVGALRILGAVLLQAPPLRVLSLRGARDATDADIAAAAPRLPHLEELAVGSTGFADAAAAAVAEHCRSLTALTATHCPLSDATALSRCGVLRTLGLQGTRVARLGMLRLLRAAGAGLTSLDVSGCPQLQPHSSAATARSTEEPSMANRSLCGAMAYECPLLETLALRHSCDDPAALMSLRRLRWLDLQGAVSPGPLPCLDPAVPGGFTPAPVDDGFLVRLLAACTLLRYVDCFDTFVMTACLKFLLAALGPTRPGLQLPGVPIDCEVYTSAGRRAEYRALLGLPPP